MDHALLAEIWLWALAVVLAVTVVLDGLDLGIGILCLLEKDETRRASMMASIEGVWHANQTWLVMAGGILFGAFPKAYGMLLSSLYLPAGLLLACLMARGIGLEYYEQAGNRRFWSTLFGLGSLGVALVEGGMLGAVVQGLPLPDHVHFLTPLAFAGSGALLGALAMACMVGLLGAGWAAGRVEDFDQRQAAMLFALGSLVFQVGLAVSLPETTPLAPGSSLGVAAASAVCLLLAVTATDSGRGFFLLAVLHAGLSLVAWLLALRPGFAEPGLTPVSASAAPGSLIIMMWGIGASLPVIAVYTIYQYRVFRGQTAYAADER